MTDTTGDTADKASWRRELRARRRGVDSVTARDAALRVASHLAASSIWRDAKHIALYVPAVGELGTEAITLAARRDDKLLYLPAVDGNAMQFRLWRDTDPLIVNRYGIDQPPDTAPIAARLDIMLLPLVGWSAAGFRLGMGGGFYDRYLGTSSSGSKPRAQPHWRLGVGYECQQEGGLDALREPCDQALDAVLTESGLRLLRT